MKQFLVEDYMDGHFIGRNGDEEIKLGDVFNRLVKYVEEKKTLEVPVRVTVFGINAYAKEVELLTPGTTAGLRLQSDVPWPAGWKEKGWVLES